MKTRNCLTKFLALAVLASMAFACQGAVLNVPYYKQEKDQWCWNASCQMVLKYYGKTYSQTAIANWAVGGLNVPNFIYGSDSTRKGCDLVLKHFGNISSTAVGAALTQSALTTEINGSRPVFVRWGWDSGGGHLVILRGISGSSVYINDPWPANGQSVNSYAWVKRGGGHTWTHSLKVNSSPSPTPQNPYYKEYVRNYNLAMTYLNYYRRTGSWYYRAYYQYYYAYAAYNYYKYRNNNAYAYYYLNYHLAYANYYYDYYSNARYPWGYSYAMSSYDYYLARAHYYGYAYSGNNSAAYRYYYYYRAYEYYYWAYANYYYYRYYRQYSAANYYYNVHMKTANNYYNLYRRY